jgi:hypothetical protein
VSVGKAKRRAKDRAKTDAAYRQALGISDDKPLPSKIGQATSGGASRGGRGAAQKGKGRNQ